MPAKEARGWLGLLAMAAALISTTGSSSSTCPTTSDPNPKAVWSGSNRPSLCSSFTIADAGEVKRGDAFDPRARSTKAAVLSPACGTHRREREGREVVDHPWARGPSQSAGMMMRTTEGRATAAPWSSCALCSYLCAGPPIRVGADGGEPIRGNARARRVMAREPFHCCGGEARPIPSLS